MVQEISSEEEFNRLTGQKGKLVVVDFAATWCGPCKHIAPEYEQLAFTHPDVLFLKVVQDCNKELIDTLNVRTFPTFRFYVNGSQVDETRGAVIQEVASKVVILKAKVPQVFGSSGISLGASGGGGGEAAASGEPVSAEDARAKRLARFGNIVSTGEGAKPDPEVARRNAKILAAAGPADVRLSSSSSPPSAPTVASPSAMDVDPPAIPASGEGGSGSGSGGTLGGGSRPRRKADPELMSQLIEMGFAEVRAKKGLMFGNGSDLENAVNWLMEHQEDADIDDPISEGAEAMEVEDAGRPLGSESAAAGGASAQSLKCDQCGTILKDVTAAELHAHKTGHSEFSESTEQLKPLTPEEKAAKVAKMKELVAARRAAREDEEKVDHVKREKARRTMGKEALKTKEEMEVIARKHEIAKAKKEKEEFARERARLKEEIARDKAERKARGGKLSTKLGVDGYNPSAPQGVYGAAAAGGSGADAGTEGGGERAAAVAAPAAEASKPAEIGEAMMKKAVDLLARQTVAGLGGTAMKTCLAYIKNALTKPEDEKFRCIKLDNNAYKTRIASCIGGTALLKSVGFAKEESRLFMSLEARDEALLTAAKEKLEAALANYVPTKAT